MEKLTKEQLLDCIEESLRDKDFEDLTHYLQRLVDLIDDKCVIMSQ